MYEKISLSKFQRPGNAQNKSCTRALSVPSESEGCKKLACKCGWQGGGFLNMQPWFGAEHLWDTVYRLTSKSTHTHSESIQWRRALLVLPMWLFFQKQHLAQISQQPLSRWCSNCHPCSILSHRQIRKCCKSPQSHLFMHVWSLLSCSKAYRSFRSRPQTVLHDQCRGELSQIHDSAPFKLGCKAFLNYVTNLHCTSFAVLWLWRILNFKCCILTLILYDSTAKKKKTFTSPMGSALSRFLH